MSKLSLSNYSELASKLANDFTIFLTKISDKDQIPSKCIYKIAAATINDTQNERNIRKNALNNINQPIKKIAFDTRRIDQEHDRNPRTNLQYWSRTQEFIDETDQKKIETFAKLIPSLENIKNKFGNQPEYFNSYARVLYDTVNRVLRVKESDLDIFRPQLDYLEQLIFTRYRLSMEELNIIKEADLLERILKKDEALLKRGNYLNITNTTADSNNISILKDGNSAQNNLMNAIFGSAQFRKPGESITITITIKDDGN